MQRSTPNRVISINWPLLFKRLKRRFSLLFHSARHKASQTEYTPPSWMARFRLTWFRLGLIALLLYVFTQKQIDFNISVGKEGVKTGQAVAANHSVSHQTASTISNGESHQLGLLSMGNATADKSATTWRVDQLDPTAVQAYVSRFERVALTEADKYGIPVAGKLAMGIYESHAGTSPVSVENNNHFGAATPNGYYPNAWSNWRAHSEFLVAEFPQLTNTPLDLDRWLDNLARSNYSSVPNYAARLRAIIERFGLK